jgi:ATP-dependent RNA helicase SUPV3L1/SUV3
VLKEGPAPTLPPPGRVSVPASEGVAAEFYEACGYRVLGGQALRIDMLDRLALRLRHDSRVGPFALVPEHLSLVGLSAEDAAPVVRALGYRSIEVEGMMKFASRRPPRRAREKAAPAPQTPAAPDSPFAKLRELSIR